MRKLLLAAIVALFAAPAGAQEPSFSIFMPPGLPSSSGLKQGWNEIRPQYCYGFAYGADLIVKLVSMDNSYIQSRHPSVQAAMMLLCATAKRVHIYSSDGVTWDGAFVSALQ